MYPGRSKTFENVPEGTLNVPKRCKTLQNLVLTLTLTFTLILTLVLALTLTFTLRLTLALTRPRGFRSSLPVLARVQGGGPQPAARNNVGGGG